MRRDVKERDEPKGCEGDWRMEGRAVQVQVPVVQIDSRLEEYTTPP